MDRVFAAQALEVPPHGVLLEQGRLGRVQKLERGGVSLGPTIVGQVDSAVAHENLLVFFGEANIGDTSVNFVPSFRRQDRAFNRM